MAAITEHYHRNQDHAEAEATGPGVRLRSSHDSAGPRPPKHHVFCKISGLRQGIIKNVLIIGEGNSKVLFC